MFSKRSAIYNSCKVVIPQKIAMKLSNSYDVTVKGNEKLNELNEKEKRLILYGTGAHGASILEKIKYLYTV